jgi:21S rRNA (GM2251-2'-O)-methyltransferase
MLALTVFQAKKAVVSAFGVSVRHQHRLIHATTTVLHDSASLDEEGRRVRRRPENEESSGSNSNDNGGGNDGSWDNFDPLAGSSGRGSSSSGSSRSYSTSTKTEANSWSGGGGGGGGGWDDFDPVGAPPSRSSDNDRRSSPGRERRNDYDGGGRGGGRSAGRGGGRGGDRRRNEVESGYGGSRGGDRGGRRDDFERKGPGGNNKFSRQNNEDKDDTRKINMKALEGAGFCHLYGLASVLNALEANRRDFSKMEDIIDMDLLQGEDYEHEMKQRERKPEAQFAPWLFVQERSGPQRGRSAEKASQAERLLELAEERGIQVATVDKGVLNTLSGNRPHQGYVLRCGAHLDFEPVTQIPHPDQDPEAPNLWLVLDEVVDPQNLGALLRSAFFLGGNNDGSRKGGKMGILVCAKNSAPPSPTVSAASAGALELMTVSSASNLPRTLATAESDGFRIVGASSSVPKDLDIPLYSLQDLPPSDRPTLVVLGSEGHGLRPLVTKSCTELVKIPGADSSDGVDSLNVSVTGGILLWHFLSGSK